MATSTARKLKASSGGSSAGTTRAPAPNAAPAATSATHRPPSPVGAYRSSSIDPGGVMWSWWLMLVLLGIGGCSPGLVPSQLRHVTGLVHFGLDRADLEDLPAHNHPRTRDVDVNAGDAGQLGQRNADGVGAMSTAHPRTMNRSSFITPLLWQTRCRVSDLRSVATTM